MIKTNNRMLRFLVVTFLFSCALGHEDFHRGSVQCRQRDRGCMLRATNAYYRKIVGGIPSLNIEPLDPIYGDVFYVNYENLRSATVLHNPTLSGLKDCIITETEVDMKWRQNRYVLSCPLLHMSGFLVRRNGHKKVPFEAEMHDYLIITNSTISIQQRCDGRYMQRYRYDVHFHPHGPLKVHVEDGRDNTVVSSLTRRAREIVIGEYMRYFITIYMNRANRYMAATPMDVLFSEPEHYGDYHY